MPNLFLCVSIVSFCRKHSHSYRQLQVILVWMDQEPVPQTNLQMLFNFIQLCCGGHHNVSWHVKTESYDVTRNSGSLIWGPITANHLDREQVDSLLYIKELHQHM